MSRTQKTIKIFIFSFLFLALFNIGCDFALAQESQFGIEYGEETGLEQVDPRVVIARVIRIFLGFLGIVAVSLIVYGGFLYMTSEGNVDKTDKARKLLIGAVIGFIIILASFGIASFIISVLMSSTGASSTTSSGGRGAVPSGFGASTTGGFVNLPGEGQSCSTTGLDPTCSAGECLPGLKCDSRDCTCKQGLSGEDEAC